jgi:phosphoglycerate dehydrogenase-like enzyme
VVPLDANPNALLWTSPSGADELTALLAATPAIQWVQLPWAGVESFAEAGVLAGSRDIRWTSAKGAYAVPVAEHALALSLAGMRLLQQRARADRWTAQAGRSLHRGAVTIVGGGGITQSLIALLAPFECAVTVVRRRTIPIRGASVLPPEQLHDGLAGADVVVLALALTPDTENLIGERELRSMSRHAWLVNVARGRHVDTDALVSALDQGWIGGAALDVTNPEPLPPGHPLWGHPRALITPHTADTPEMAAPLLAERVATNVRRFAAGEELVGEVDVAAGY